MAVMTQVHVSRAKFAGLAREFGTASEFVNVQKRVLNQVRGENAAERSSEQTLIRERMNMIVAEAKYDIAYADLQNAYGNILAAVGVDLVDPAAAASMPVGELARHIGAVLRGAPRVEGRRPLSVPLLRRTS